MQHGPEFDCILLLCLSILQVSDFNLAKILDMTPAGSASSSAGGPANPQWLVSDGRLSDMHWQKRLKKG